MSKVDLSLAKAGDVAHFRCGGQWTIEEVKNYVGRFELVFIGSDCGDNYSINGQIFGDKRTHPLDIIKVESK